MGILASGVIHIINAIEDLLYIIESQDSLAISTGCDEKNYKFMKLTFPLKNGTSEVRVYNNGGACYYIDCHGNNIKSIGFNDSSLTDTEGSFHKALKALVALDRQQTSTAKNINLSIDRASFGLAEVN